MTKRKIRLPEALQLLANNRLDSSYSVEFSDSDRVEATDAIKLGAIGVDERKPNCRSWYYFRFKFKVIDVRSQWGANISKKQLSSFN